MHPKLQTLVALASAFSVSLDFLVFGGTRTTGAGVDYGPLQRHFDSRLAHMLSRADRQRELVSRITDVLLKRITSIAGSMLDTHQTSIQAGLLLDSETMRVEQYSLETWILSMNLQYDIVASEAGPEEAGRFLPIVARNIGQQRQYRFLLLARVRDWTKPTSTYRRLLTQNCGDEQVVKTKCHFRVTHVPVMNGIGLYKLDIRALSEEEPASYERLRDYIDSQSWCGYTIPPSAELQADALMDSQHLKQARELFAKLWKGGKRI